MNFLEELVAEWYRYKGFFVQTNIKYGLREHKGGYEGEIDIVILDPNSEIRN